MSATGLASFDTTIQKTNIWLDDIMDELGWDDLQRAYHALQVVLHTLRSQLPVNESAPLAAQFPQLIRGMYYEGWKPSSPLLRERQWIQFLRHVGDAFAHDLDADSDKIARAVLKALSRHVSHGEIVNVKRCLPEPVREHSKG